MRQAEGRFYLIGHSVEEGISQIVEMKIRLDRDILQSSTGCMPRIHGAETIWLRFFCFIVV